MRSEVVVSGSAGCLDQFAECPCGHEELWRVVTCPRGRRERRLVAAEGVVEERVCPVGVLDSCSLTASGRACDRRLDQLGRVRLLSDVRRAHERGIRRNVLARGLCDSVALGDQQAALGELATQGDCLAHHIETNSKYLERPRVARELDLARRDLQTGVVVPDIYGRGGREPPPPEQLLHRDLATGERRCRAL